MRRHHRIGRRHQSPAELYDQIKRLARAVDRQGGALKAAVEAVNAKKISDSSPKLHYVNAHRWRRAWRLIEKRRKKPGLLLEWLREVGSSRVFHLAALEDPVAARKADRLPGSRKSLRQMSEAEIREAIQSRNRRAQVRKNATRKAMGRRPRPADDLSKAIKRFLGVWKRARTALPRTASGLVDDLVAIRPAVKKLAVVTRKLKTMVGLQTGVAGGDR